MNQNQPPQTIFKLAEMLDDPKCHCASPVTQYSERYDAIYCAICRSWLESKCSGCDFCDGRPDKAPEGVV